MSEDGGVQAYDEENELIAWDSAKEEEFRKMGTKRRKMLLIQRRLENSPVITSVRQQNKHKLKDLWQKGGPHVKKSMSRRKVKERELAKARKKWYRWRINQQAERRTKYEKELERKKKDLCAVWETERSQRAQKRREENNRYRSFINNTPKRPTERRHVPLVSPVRAELAAAAAPGAPLGNAIAGLEGEDAGALEGTEDTVHADLAAFADMSDGVTIPSFQPVERQKQQQQENVMKQTPAFMNSSAYGSKTVDSKVSSTGRSIRRGSPKMQYGDSLKDSSRRLKGMGGSSAPGSPLLSRSPGTKIRRPKMFVRNSTNRKLAAEKRAQEEEIKINVKHLHRSKTFLQSFKTGPVSLSKSFRNRLRQEGSFRRKKFEEFDRSHGASVPPVPE